MKFVNSALVIGGGIAGPVAALALRKAGIDATIYEAHPGASDGVGGFLTLAPNGLAALGLVGAEDAVRAISQPIPDIVIENGAGKPLGRVAGLRGLEPSRTMRRSDLYRVLRDSALAMGIRIERGKRLTSVDERPSEIRAAFEDGTSASAEVLIGADGIRSTVRTLIDPSAPGPEYVGLLGFGVGSALPCNGRRGPSSEMHFAFGKRAFFGYWEQSDGTPAFFSNLPHEGPLTLAEVRRIPNTEWLRRLREAHAGDCPAADLLEHTNPDELFAAGPLEMMPKLPRWHRDRMVLVGDSAHAPSASSGQGASLAVESAIEMARCLRDIPDVESAFRAYARIRRPRTERIAASAAKTNSNKAAGPFAKALMGFFMPLAMKTFLTPERMFGDTHRYRIDWDACVGSLQ